MDLAFTPEDLAFRSEVRAFIAEHFDEDMRHQLANSKNGYMSKEAHIRWQKALHTRGWAATNWPKEYGGAGFTAAQKYLFELEMSAAGAPGVVAFGMKMVAPVIMKFGNAAQKAEHLPKILASERWWCQGYSEPGSGSDLASLSMKCEDKGDHYLLNGSKIWTTLAQYADWMFNLVRTDNTGKTQEGISFILVDMKTPGITVRPLILLDEGHEVNEVFFDDVKVPVENLVHEEGKGWTVAKYLLGHERLNTGRIGASKREMLKLKEIAARTTKDGRPLLDDPRFRDKVSRVEIELMALEITNLRFVDEMRRTGRIGAEVSMLKIKGTEIQQAITELLMQVAGPLAQSFRPLDYENFDGFTASIAPRYFNFRKTSIYAGSNEIQRNIIAKAALGL